MYGRKIFGWFATLVLSIFMLSTLNAKTNNSKSQIIDRGDKVQLNLKNVDIDVIIQYLAKFSGEHYLKDPTAKAKISIMANKPVTRREAVIILEEALIFNNFTIMKHGLAKYVVPTRFAKQYGIDVKIGKAGVDKINTANLQMRFFKVEYIGVRKMQTILQTILGKNGQIIPHPQEMMLQVIDTTFSLKRMSELIDKMDVPDSLLEMYVIHLENTTAAKMINQLKAIFVKNLVLKGSPNVVEAEQDKINFIADDRTNKIIVICHNKYIAQIRETARILDQELGNIKQVQVYKVQYAEPEALAKQLTELFPKDSLKMLPDERLNSILVISPSDRMIRAVLDMARKLDMKGAAADGDVRVYYLEHSDAKDMADILTKLFDKKKSNQKKPVSIVPDESTNALVITGSKAQFDEVVAILKKLDIFRAQVLVEAVIVEVQMSYVKSLGVNLSAFGGNVGDNNAFGAVTNMGVTPGLGLNFGVVENDAELADLAANQKIKALLRAFKNSNQANVLSAPQILTMDNEEAKIVVGEVVPLPTGVNTALNTGNQTISNFRFEDVGLDLNIKPRITQKETISLDVKLEIKARSSDALFEFQVPIITRRSIDTTVNTRDGDTVVIGGLMRDQKDHTVEKIPLLSRIPVLGKLFRNKERRNQKTNLFVFLTPYVLSDEEELQHITKRINTSMNSSMSKTEFNPLSYKEGQGIIAAVEDDERLIKPIKVDRISVDGKSESLENENAEVSVINKTEKKGIEASAPLKLEHRKEEKSNLDEASDSSSTDEKSSSKNLETSKVDANPNKVSAIETAKFIQMLDLNSVDENKSSIPKKIKPPRSNVLKLAGDTKEVSKVTKNSKSIKSQKIDTSEKLPSKLQTSVVLDISEKKLDEPKKTVNNIQTAQVKESVKLSNKIEGLEVEKNSPHSQEPEEYKEGQEQKVSHEKKVSVLDEKKSSDPETKITQIKTDRKKSRPSFISSIRKKIKKLTRDIGRRKSKEKVASEPEIEPIIKPKEKLESLEVAKSRETISRPEITVVKKVMEQSERSGPKNITEPSKSVAISKADISKSPSNASAIAIKEIDNQKNRPPLLSAVTDTTVIQAKGDSELNENKLGLGIKNVKVALKSMRQKFNKTAGAKAKANDTGDEKFDSLMVKVRNQRQTAHLKASRNRNLLFPARKSVNKKIKPQESFDQLVGDLERSISRRTSYRSERLSEVGKIAREKDEEFNQLVEKLEKNLSRN